MKQRNKRVWLALSGLLMVIFLSLPTIFSTSFVQQRLLKTINQKISGNLELDSCSLSWSKSLVCRDLVYTNHDKGLTLEIPELLLSKGLVHFIGAPLALGTIELFQPHVRLEPRSTESVPVGTPQKGSQPQQPQQGESNGGKGDFLDQITGVFRIKDGSLSLMAETGKPLYGAQEINTEIQLAEGALEYNLALKDGSGGGSLIGKGFLNFPDKRQSFTDTLVSESEILLDQFDGTGLLDLASLFIAAPRGSFSVDGQFHLKTSGLNDMELNGSLSLSDLDLTGGVLGLDHPMIENTQIDLALARSVQHQWQMKQLKVVAGLSEMEVTGNYGRKNGTLKLLGSLDLAQLSVQFPHLLHFNTENEISSGTVKFSLQLQQGGATYGLDLRGLLSQLKGRKGKLEFSWDDPTIFSLQAEQLNGSPVLRNLEVTAPFFQVTAGGNLDNFSLQAKTDLEQLTKELSNLFSFDYGATGKVAVDVSTFVVEDGRYALEALASVDNLALYKGQTVLLPSHPFSLSLAAKGADPFAKAGKLGKKRVQIDLESRLWLGELGMRAGFIKVVGKPFFLEYDVKGMVDADKITSVLQGTGALGSSTAAAGVCRIETAGVLQGKRLNLNKVILDGEAVKLKHQDWDLLSDTLQLSLNNPTYTQNTEIQVRPLETLDSWADYQPWRDDVSNMDLVTGKLSLYGLNLTSPGIELNGEEVLVTNFRDPIHGFSLALDGTMVLDKLMSTVRNPQKIPQDLKMKGMVTTKVYAEGDADGDIALGLTMEGEELEALKKGKEIFAGNRVALQAEINGTPSEGVGELSFLEVASPLFNLSATGGLRKTPQAHFFLQGKLQPVLPGIAAILSTKSGKSVHLAGASPGKFELIYPLTASKGALLQELVFSTELDLAEMRYPGIDVKELKVPLSIKDGLLSADIKGQLNQGKLAVSPHGDFTRNPGLLTVAAGSQVLEKVMIDQPLAEIFLAKLHPLFGSLAQPKGAFSMLLDGLNWPLEKGGGQRAAFTATIDVSDVQLINNGLLQDVLGYFNQETATLQFKENSITCKGAGGRISCDPVKVLVAESEMLVGGSVGLDKSLDYYIEIPVTEALVGKEGARLLEGTRIKVPIRGTVGEPTFNKTVVREAVTGLIEQTAVKAAQKQVEKVLPKLLNTIFGNE